MIDKIRGLLQVKEDIEALHETFEQNKNAVKELQEELQALKQIVAETQKSQKEFLSQFEQNIGIINESKEALKKEVYDFKLLKTQTQEKILKKLEEEIETELKKHFERLRTDATLYNELKTDVLGIAKTTQKLSYEIQKFIGISEHIKKGDFELTKFANKLLQMDREKLELMRKIDTLEHLIGKMRRQ